MELLLVVICREGNYRFLEKNWDVSLSGVS